LDWQVNEAPRDSLIASAGRRWNSPPEPMVSGLELFSGLEPDRLAGRDVGDLTGARVAANAALSWLHYEHAKATKFDAFASLQGGLHRFKQRFDRSFRFDLWNAGLLGDSIHDIKLDHIGLRSRFSLIARLGKACIIRSRVGPVNAEVVAKVLSSKVKFALED
jgi:hypothetical protein